MAEALEREYRRYLGEFYAGEGRCRVEAETVLPDYKEAAHRILRVDTKTRVNSKNVYTQGRSVICEIEGVAVFHILYLSDRQKEKGIPSSYLTQENFSYTFKIPAEENVDPEEVVAVVELKTENPSFKLMGPRKVSVRCDVVILLNAKCNHLFSYYSKDLPSDIQTKRREVNVSSLVAIYQKEMTFSETIALPESAMPIGEICEMDVDLFPKKIVADHGGIRFSGSCDVSCSYVTQGDESLVSFYQPIEFEKNLGLEACTADHVCQVVMTPNFLKATADINENGENKNIHFEIGCTAEVRLYTGETLEILEDAFSTEDHLELDVKPVCPEEIVLSSDFSIPLRASLEREEKLVRAEGIRSHVDFKNCYLEEGKIAVEGKIWVRYLGVREEGELIHLESNYDFKTHLPSEIGMLPENVRDCRIEICGGARGVDLDSAGETLEMRFEICGQVMLLCRRQIQAVCEIRRGERRKRKDRGILFYYPEKGEDLWSVCKQYAVSPRALKEENEMEGDQLPRTVHVTL
ncbi:MAG: hypothetical protein IKD18_06975 [Clostridia bacterium]|nr:hypothetical protein [Clostridia bacterium]